MLSLILFENAPKGKLEKLVKQYLFQANIHAYVGDLPKRIFVQLAEKMKAMGANNVTFIRANRHKETGMEISALGEMLRTIDFDGMPVFAQMKNEKKTQKRP